MVNLFLLWHIFYKKTIYLGNREFLTHDVNARPPTAAGSSDALRVAQDGTSTHCDDELDSDHQDLSVADMIIMQSSFDCKSQ